MTDKERFLQLVDSIEREGMDKPLLHRQLTESDFFEAPASTKYHHSEEGGLCKHSLEVYDTLCKLNENMNLGFDSDSVKIVALFHDFSKMNYYTTELKNKKEYSENGSKRDSNGRYDWVTYPGYAVRDASSRFMFGNHEQNAAYMTNTFIPLTIEEYSAILHHHGGMAYDSTKEDVSEVFTRYPLALFLHLADMTSAYGHTPVEVNVVEEEHE